MNMNLNIYVNMDMYMNMNVNININMNINFHFFICIFNPSFVFLFSLFWWFPRRVLLCKSFRRPHLLFPAHLSLTSHILVTNTRYLHIPIILSQNYEHNNIYYLYCIQHIQLIQDTFPENYLKSLSNLGWCPSQTPFSSHHLTFFSCFSNQQHYISCGPKQHHYSASTRL